MYSTQSWGRRAPEAEPERRPRRQERGSAGVLSSLVQFESDSEDEDTFMRWGGTAPTHAPREETSLSRIKTTQGIEGQWTITDADADRAGRRMIYSSITPHVYMLSTEAGDDEQTLLDFHDRTRRYGFESFGLWSIRFSADGKEIVAGASRGNIMVYDVESDRRSLCVQGHRDDVNAVCFADESSTNILVSGSDDGYVKIWDRRSLNSSQTPSGVLVGATEGITYTAPKGDGRYVLANSKDQACRLYDLRKMRSWGEFADEPDAVQEYGKPGYDYRHGGYQSPEYAAHPRDCSVMTYRGHSVERTLIRCHFSPAATTGQSYVFSGSSDGRIHIWSLDGRVVHVLDRALSQPLRHQGAERYTDPSAPEPPPASRVEDPYYDTRQRVVRDVAWHSQEPTLMSTCWDMNAGYRRGGSIAKHEWKGLGKNGLERLEDWVEKEALEASM
ncbi:hypothetical protein A1Q1_00332 [Trichosporon asahii var. asahii CBS 2479]|uniref:Uncharacterized protein n=1 Tax=Trichosporon asahii var. asahii (strain ATCC 90039 / CBS 2479 / JCM 2466 / KCTC 7840 / NBRC 103889/ NCYC 2677 / UAMH 7654) TaxID=1186058 RepID=J4UG39_TRIAS|nr:hypothetical protein A1Q1_00332 [Trichosporon asahii var. asahii CBS 2479]EJT50400.1 hypothetical protein A1Q1_00332 [Trichosporon asahii var. asahii CBS 2479]